MRTKLTIGMACAGDFDGPAFTIQSLRLYHHAVLRECEILIVDNTPESQPGARLRRFCAGLPGVRYHAFPEPKGTAAPRSEIFNQAKSENVLCLDSHVLLPAAAINRLIDWFDRNPESRDLVTGPIVWDDLAAANGNHPGLATHFKPTWGAGMYGQWDTDSRGLDPDGEPFEIPMMGLGLFACRRDAFPGFNHRLVGFGGEEGYLHEKVRRNGGRNLCLPWLRWWHRFNESVSGAAPYVATVEDKAWNYCVGWGELGWDLAPAREHFATLINVAEFDRIAAAAELGDASPPHRAGQSALAEGADDCGCDGGNATPRQAEPEDFAAHAERLRPYMARLPADAVVYEHAAAGSPAAETLAELHAGMLLSFSPRHGKSAFAAFRERGKERMQILSSELRPPFREADLICLTGYADGRLLAPHLTAAGENARRFIAVLGTSQADTPEAPGVMTAVRTFLRERPEWSVIEKSPGGRGLAVLSNNAADKPELPPLSEQAKNFLGAALRTATAAIQGERAKAAPELAEARLSVCAGCEFRNGDRCSSCGCYLAPKSGLLGEDCPEGRWPSPLLYEVGESEISTMAASD